MNRLSQDQNTTYLFHAQAIFFFLLRCGADMKKKNDRGETAYDLAIKSGYEVLSRRLVASLGQSQLEKLLRGKQTPLE